MGVTATLRAIIMIFECHDHQVDADSMLNDSRSQNFQKSKSENRKTDALLDFPIMRCRTNNMPRNEHEHQTQELAPARVRTHVSMC